MKLPFYSAALIIYISCWLQHASASCVDRNRFCRDWARRGECQRNPQYMNSFCLKSCGCGCVDKNYNCNYWARIGECVRRPAYMRPNCRKSCRLCPVNGNWGAWGRWSACTRSCGGGSQRRSRTCSNPAPRNEGRSCVGSRTQTKRCNISPCVTVANGNWASWGKWSACSKTCGGGYKIRTRTCSNPAPQNGGRPCQGTRLQTVSCNSQRCPVNGNWGSWSKWSVCSAICGGGKKKRTRTCSNPAPKYGGRTCQGPNQQTENCNTWQCPVVHGNWGSWNSWSSCSKTCGGREKTTRLRYCIDPPPEHGGRPCEGYGIQTRECNTGKPKLPSSRIVGGRVTKIQNWPWQVGLQSDDSGGIFCGGSLLNREWVITAAHCIADHVSGGRDCVDLNSGQIKVVLGESDLKKIEGQEIYKVDGAWGAWRQWTPCSKSCGIGVAKRIRHCNNPRPQNDGRPCVGNNQETRRCSLRSCTTATSVSPTTSVPPATAASLNCGRPKRSRIVGGEIASNRDWPWQVGLQSLDDDFIFCGGSLIDREWVLTAAHCIVRNNPSRRGCVAPNPGLRVVLGEFDVENIDGHEVKRTISEVCMHHSYDHAIYNNDIALLRLSTPLPGYNETMSPVCLPTPSTNFPPGTNCSVTGWGKTHQHGWVSSKLRVAHVPIIDHTTCKDEYLRRTGDVVTDKMICAGYQEGKVDSCKGDSGGPFVCKERGRYILVGATSWGVGCAKAGQPGVYTDIKDFLSWIQSVTSPAEP